MAYQTNAPFCRPPVIFLSWLPYRTHRGSRTGLLLLLLSPPLLLLPLQTDSAKGNGNSNGAGSGVFRDRDGERTHQPNATNAKKRAVKAHKPRGKMQYVWVNVWRHNVAQQCWHVPRRRRPSAVTGCHAKVQPTIPGSVATDGTRPVECSAKKHGEEDAHSRTSKKKGHESAAFFSHFTPYQPPERPNRINVNFFR